MDCNTCHGEYNAFEVCPECTPTLADVRRNFVNLQLGQAEEMLTHAYLGNSEIVDVLNNVVKALRKIAEVVL